MAHGVIPTPVIPTPATPTPVIPTPATPTPPPPGLPQRQHGRGPGKRHPAKWLCLSSILALSGCAAMAPAREPAEGSTSPMPSTSAKQEDIAHAGTNSDALGLSRVTHPARHALLAQLHALAAAPGLALGHQDTVAYGVGWTAGAQADAEKSAPAASLPERSDVALICEDFPAVFGWDAFGIENEASANGDGVDFALMRAAMIRHHARGGLNTLSWHLDNPVSGGNAWDTTPAVTAILPGGTHHEDFVVSLDRLADFIATIQDEHGKGIPLLVRPFHEHTGGWFWWGRNSTREEDYVAIFRFVVDYLVHTRKLQQLAFAFSPGGGEVTSPQSYLYGYPGDAYVDVLGFDYYYFRDSKRLVSVAEIAVREARARSKVAAITEFGPKGGLNSFGVAGATWFSKQFLSPLAAHPETFGLAYALAWRNARPEHCFISYPAHPSAADFRAVCLDPRVLLRADLAALSR